MWKAMIFGFLTIAALSAVVGYALTDDPNVGGRRRALYEDHTAMVVTILVAYTAALGVLFHADIMDKIDESTAEARRRAARREADQAARSRGFSVVLPGERPGGSPPRSPKELKWAPPPNRH